LAIVATRSASSAGSNPTAGEQHSAAAGPGDMGSKELITVIDVMRTIADPDTHINNFQYEIACVER
jgi:hypothetical protein